MSAHSTFLPFFETHPANLSYFALNVRSFNNRVTFSVNCDERLVSRDVLRQFVREDYNAALSRTLAHMHAAANADAAKSS